MHNTITTEHALNAAQTALPLVHLRPRIHIYEKRPCGRVLFEIANPQLRELVKRTIGFPSLTPEKLEALKSLGVAFVLVDNPANSPHSIERE